MIIFTLPILVLAFVGISEVGASETASLEEISTISKNSFSLKDDDQALYNSIALFKKQRKVLTDHIRSLKRSKENTNRDWSTLANMIHNMKDSYARIPRVNTDSELLHDVQFQLRLTNSLLRSFLEGEHGRKRLSGQKLNELLYEAQLFSYDFKNKFYLSPSLTPPIKGVKGPNLPLKYWSEKPEYYNYTFDDKTGEVLFRGLNLSSGDLILNYTTQKPDGLFTAISERQNIFSHISMIVFFQTSQGRLPMVIDVAQSGVRLIPLHHFLSPDLLIYAEIFRHKDPPPHFEVQLDIATKKITRQPHPYNLSESENSGAFTCPEAIQYIFNLIGQEPILKKERIKDSIYKNILRFGSFRQTYLMPSDFIYDGRFEYVGYLDNSPPLEDTIVQDVMMDLFREKMDSKVVKSDKGTLLKLSQWAIKSMYDPNSKMGLFLMKTNDFTPETLPVGDANLIGAVGAVDIAFSTAMINCTYRYKNRAPSPCFLMIESLLSQNFSEERFSVGWWRGHVSLRRLVDKELHIFNKFFE